jgi:hypothetical protein
MFVIAFQAPKSLAGKRALPVSRPNAAAEMERTLSRWWFWQPTRYCRKQRQDEAISP